MTSSQGYVGGGSAIFERLKEERLRLGLSQTAFATIAGVTKSAQIKWESGASSAPTAPALAAMANAGVDVLYVITGRRADESTAELASRVERLLPGILRDVIEPDRRALPGESPDATEKRVLEQHRATLDHILINDGKKLPSELIEQIEVALDILTPSGVILHRAHHHGRQKARRRELRDQLLTWLDAGSHVPRDAVTSVAVTLALDHGVPMRLIVELIEEVRDDAGGRPTAG